MNDWLQYLSGNVPGGIFLYLLVILIVSAILVFMLRVNELFKRKHFNRTMLTSFVVITAIYIFLWMSNPPAAVYQRYTVDIFETDSEENWLGYYLADILSSATEFQDGADRFFIPYDWFFKIAKSAELQNNQFRKNIWENLPMHRVLAGRLENENGKQVLRIQLLQFPGKEILAEKSFDFKMNNLPELRLKIVDDFRGKFPFKKKSELAPIVKQTKEIVQGKIAFFDKNYTRSIDLMNNATDTLGKTWINYNRIRLAAQARANAGRADPLAPVKTDWEVGFNDSRKSLLVHLKNGFTDRWINTIVAESYLWEEKYESAEIFLENALLQNASDVEVLLNLSFLHPSRYREFGFERSREIYQRILTIFPAYENVLIKWSEYILDNNPAYTAPPEFAKNYLKKYLKINPGSHSVWSMLGKLLAQQRRRSEAKYAFLKSDSLLPNNAVTHYDIGILLYEWEKLDEAEKSFQKAVAINDYLDAHLYLGAIYRKRGDYKKALAEFRYRVKNKTGDNDIYAFQAMRGIRECLEMLGEKTGGEQ